MCFQLLHWIGWARPHIGRGAADAADAERALVCGHHRNIHHHSHGWTVVRWCDEFTRICPARTL
jgi:hypothetical protein